MNTPTNWATHVREIREKLGLSLREAKDAFDKYGSATAAINALLDPTARAAWEGPYQELARERRYSSAVVKVAMDLLKALEEIRGDSPVPPEAKLREDLRKMIEEKLKQPI